MSRRDDWSPRAPLTMSLQAFTRDDQPSSQNERAHPIVHRRDARAPSAAGAVRAPDELIGCSRQIHELKEGIERIAWSDAKVLITGESGVGKELVARAIHQRSGRASGPFVAVNCAGLAESLLESELFGHVKGSFTGAYRDRLGKLELANRGTIFLDEIGETTLRMQGLLLRFLETGELQKVGADRLASRVDVRVLAATNRDLRAMIARSEFREDLFFRLNVLQIRLPPLRERRDDVPVLLDHFVRRLSGRYPGRTRSFSPEVLGAFGAYDWPGNVRELENVVERLMVTGRTPVVGLDELPPEIVASRPETPAGATRPSSTIDELHQRLVRDRQSFWIAVYPLYMDREITRADVREIVRRGLRDSFGSYKALLRLFNIPPGDYKKFLNFLREHGCHIPYREYR
jgi:two-component system response regulator HydG